MEEEEKGALEKKKRGWVRRNTRSILRLERIRIVFQLSRRRDKGGGGGCVLERGAQRERIGARGRRGEEEEEEEERERWKKLSWESLPRKRGSLC